MRESEYTANLYLGAAMNQQKVTKLRGRKPKPRDEDYTVEELPIEFIELRVNRERNPDDEQFIRDIWGDK